MNIQNRLKKISEAMQAQANADGGKPFLTLEQWTRRYNGEDIRSEVPPHRLAEYDEYERIAGERVRQAEETYNKHNPELLEAE